MAVLLAVGRGLDHLSSEGDHSARNRAAPGASGEVHLGDLAAAVLLTHWARHGYGLPDAYRPGPFACGLERLGRTVQRNAPALTFRYRPPHTAAALNRTADALARLGLRAARGAMSADDIVPLARCHAEQGMAAAAVTRS